MTSRLSRFGLAALGLFLCLQLAACGGGGGADPQQPEAPEEPQTTGLKCAP